MALQVAEFDVTDFVSDEEANGDIAGPIGPVTVHRSCDLIERKDTCLQPLNGPAEEMGFDHVIDKVDEPVLPAVMNRQAGAMKEKRKQALESGVKADGVAIVGRFMIGKCVGSGAFDEFEGDSRNQRTSLVSSPPRLECGSGRNRQPSRLVF